MSRLPEGVSVPHLTGLTLSGNEISLADYQGSPLILSFYRYSGCQLCNLRIHDFIKQYRKIYQPAGVQAIAVFQSPLHKMKKYQSEHQAPFEMISDPDNEWYDAFGLETSWMGLARAAIQPTAIVRSIAKGYARVDPDGAMHRLPADFLINAEGKVDVPFYAKDISEHIPFKTISNWLETHLQS